MNDISNLNEKDDVDRQIEKLQKLLTKVAGYDPNTCRPELHAKVVRNDKGGIEILSFAQGSKYQINEQIKMLMLLEFFAAVENQDLAKIKNFVEKELVDINAITPMPKSPIKPTTALNIATGQENNKEIIEYLLANGAKDNVVEHLGDSMSENLEQ